MARCISEDLRVRVIGAVEGGMSRNAAARRFGVSIASAVRTKMARLRGRAPRGERCRACVPHGHWKTTTLVAGLRLDGLIADGDRRRDERRSLYRLRGNLAGADAPSRRHCHHGQAAGPRGRRKAIERAGAALMFLPPYSPDFNPIEQAFAKLKALLRKAAARTVAALEAAIASALDAFSSQECANYFTNSGYEPD